MLWLPFGFFLGLVMLKLGFGSVDFGNPMSEGMNKYWCAFMCSTVWTGLLCATLVSLFHEMMIKRVLCIRLDAPPIPRLWLKLLLTYVVGSCAMMLSWWTFFAIFKTMIPFLGKSTFPLLVVSPSSLQLFIFIFAPLFLLFYYYLVQVFSVPFLDGSQA